MKFASDILKNMILIILKVYKSAISPFLGSNCRFHPTCSTYAVEAVKHHGAFHGGFLAAKRVFKCHPFHPGGYDPVPLFKIKVKEIDNKYMENYG